MPNSHSIKSVKFTVCIRDESIKTYFFLFIIFESERRGLCEIFLDLLYTYMYLNPKEPFIYLAAPLINSTTRTPDSFVYYDKNSLCLIWNRAKLWNFLKIHTFHETKTVSDRLWCCGACHSKKRATRVNMTGLPSSQKKIYNPTTKNNWLWNSSLFGNYSRLKPNNRLYMPSSLSQKYSI